MENTLMENCSLNNQNKLNAQFTYIVYIAIDLQRAKCDLMLFFRNFNFFLTNSVVFVFFTFSVILVFQIAAHKLKNTKYVEKCRQRLKMIKAILILQMPRKLHQLDV